MINQQTMTLPPAPRGRADMDGKHWMDQVYREHGRPLYRFLLHLTLGNRQAAEDLLQDTFLRAWHNINRLPTDATAIRPWLFTVARNRAIDVARARKSRPIEVELPDGASERVELDLTERTLNATVIRQAMRHLRPEHREVLIELYLKGSKVAEVAQRLSIPEGTVKSRAFYALRSLRTFLDPTI